MAIGAFLFLFGLIIGSFLNVAVLRYDGSRFFRFSRLGGRSACPGCHTHLRPYELIPVFSFFLQAGRCRTCRMRISWQYPLLELAAGFAFLLPYLCLLPHYSFPEAHPFAFAMVAGWILVFVCLAALSAVDIRMMLIPDELTATIAATGLMFAVSDGGFFSAPFPDSFLGNYASLFPAPFGMFGSHFLGGIFGFAALGAVSLLSRGRAMGMGDVKLAGAMGLVLGFPDIMFALALGFLLGGAFGIGYLVRLRGGAAAGMKAMVPFGPFLALGFVAFVLFGHALFGWYFALL